MQRLLRALLCVCPLTLAASLAGEDLPVEAIRLPPGFTIRVWARVPNARSLAMGPKGTVFIGTRSDGGVFAVKPGPSPEVGGKVVAIARGLQMPNGVAVRDGALYVAEVSRLLRFDDIEARLDTPPAPAVVTDRFPKDTHHGWKFIAFGPDGLLYVPVGAPCNICEPKEPVYAAIHRMKPDGSQLELYASGVRNTVGFDWHPETHELWFTDNGRDWMGDDLPPDELNRAPRPGANFGYPYCHGKALSDPDYGKKKPCSQFQPPEMELGPHVASLGMRFYTGLMFPESYRNQIFIAEHGSWNRSTKIGYRISLVRLQDGRAVSYETFAEGWLRKTLLGVGGVWGRPVDLLVMPDGALLVSDDYAGTIYRISYRKP
ncbi:MAG: PQQ-dependent sugar dehydrogenase [Thermoanaerobaculia bacterium]